MKKIAMALILLITNLFFTKGQVVIRQLYKGPEKQKFQQMYNTVHKRTLAAYLMNNSGAKAVMDTGTHLYNAYNEVYWGKVMRAIPDIGKAHEIQFDKMDEAQDSAFEYYSYFILDGVARLEYDGNTIDERLELNLANHGEYLFGMWNTMGVVAWNKDHNKAYLINGAAPLDDYINMLHYAGIKIDLPKYIDLRYYNYIPKNIKSISENVAKFYSQVFKKTYQVEIVLNNGRYEEIIK